MDIPVDIRFHYHDSLFSYQCNICKKCCHGKGIQVNPYEAMRLAECLGISTSDFREKYLNHQFLRHKDNSDACIFLSDKGCTVHKDRPLVCRLYPLGRITTENGEDLYIEVTPHPESEGVYSEESTVYEYLLSQNAEPFIDAEKAYLELIQQMACAATNSSDSKALDHAINSPEALDEEYVNTEWILDPDPVILKYCELKNIPFPTRTPDKLELHLQALYAWVDGKWDLSDIMKSFGNK